MALSNIFREPRREITEQAAGLLGLAVLLLPAILMTLDYSKIEHTGGMPPTFLMAGFLGIATGIGWMVLLGLALLTHRIGEELCDFLANRGLELRPKNRKNRK